jgi:GcrA cell cycle regulator
MTDKVNKVTLMDLKNSMCKWPIGDPQNDNFHFCGQHGEPGLSYCEKHTNMAYRVDTGSRVSTAREKAST